MAAGPAEGVLKPLSPYAVHMRRALVVVASGAVVVAFLIGGIANGADEKPQVKYLQQQTIDLVKGPDPLKLRDTWDIPFKEEVALRQKLSEVTKRPPLFSAGVYVAEFETRGGRIILSATSTPDQDCRSYSNVGLSKNLISCPMRVALVSGDAVKVIYSEDQFALADNGDTGSSKLSTNDKGSIGTLITFDPLAHTISSRLSLGENQILSSDEKNSNDEFIKLNY